MPTTIHVAYTSPVNPSGSSPVITREQLWNGLVRKVRHAQEFIPVFTSCEIIKEEDNVITRRANIREGQMEHVKDRYIEEVCTLYAPTKIDFLSPANHNSLVQNIISDGEGFGDEGLNLTFLFDWTYADVKEGSEEEQKKVQEQRRGAKEAIEKTLAGIRQMIEKGVL